jgi:hypothetical protein
LVIAFHFARVTVLGSIARPKRCAQFELLAALFHADAPNDLAPSA